MTDSGFQRATLSELISRAESDINTRLPGADSRVRRSVLSVLARMASGLNHSLYGYLDWIANQVFPDTAEEENLDRWGAIFGIIRKAPTKATGNVTMIGDNGSIIPVGAILQRNDGVQFVTTEAKTIVSGTVSVAVQCSTAGEIGNTAASTVLTFASPVAGVLATAISGSLSGGADSEKDDALRARVLFRLQNPPQGGSEKDYEAWALEVPGVTRAFVYGNTPEIGIVTVRFMMDDTYSDGIPLSGDVVTVQAALDEKRPVTAVVLAAAPIADALNFTIQLLDSAGVSVTDPTVQAAVEAELEDMLFRDAVPGGTILLSRINEAISVATGEYDHALTVPSANVTHTADHIAVMGTITWL